MKRNIFLALALLTGALKTAYSQQSRIDSLNRILISSAVEVKVDILIQLAQLYRYSNTDSALSKGRAALSLAHRANDIQGEIESNYCLAEVYFGIGKIDEVYHFAGRGLKLGDRLSDSHLKCKGLILNSKYYSYIGANENSLALAGEALTIAMQHDYPGLLISCYDILGDGYLNMGNYDLSSEYYFKGLEAAEKTGDQRGIRDAEFKIGYLFVQNQKFDDAKVYFDKALEISMRLGDKTGIRDYYHEIGVWYQKKGQPVQARSMFDKAIDLAYELKDTLGIAILLGNTGSILREMNEPEKSLENLFQALELKLAIHRDPSHTYNDIAESYLMLDDHENAGIYAEKAVGAATRSADQGQLAVANYILSQCYYSAGDYYNAYLKYQNYVQLKDSLFNLQKSHQIESIKTQYETEKKEEKIELLNHQHRSEKFRRNVLAAFSGLLLIIGILLIARQRSKTREQRLLYEKEQEVDRMKSRFFANITHELRTPLTLILGPIEILRSRIASKENIRQLNVLEKNSNRLLDLINQLLDLSKIESGKMKLQSEPYDILQLVKRVSGFFESLVKLKEIDLKVSSHLEYSVLNIDVDKMEKVLVNLISNALKFTPENGSIRITLDLEEGIKGSGKGSVTIKIKDNGRGIPAEDMEYIFDQYFQSADSVNSEYAGTGLGLALTKELVELHGGTITVKSGSGSGSEFTIYMPKDLLVHDFQLKTLKRNESGWIRVQDMVSSEIQLVPDAGSDGQTLILLVEDNIEVSDYISNIVHTVFKVEQAKDGKEGVEMALHLIPDLVISDVMMPGMNGYDLCKKLKSEESTSHVPVILLTARGSTVDKIKGLEHQADAYLVKPFSPKELMTLIKNLVESRRQLRERFSREFIFKPGEVEVTSTDDRFLEKLNTRVESHLEDENLGVDDLAGMMNMSRSQLHRKLKALTNLAPSEFIRNYRLIRAKELIIGRTGSAAEIAFTVGFSSPSYFTRCFREYFGYPPSETLKQTAK